MRIFIFPFNYDYSPKFLGVFEYKTCLPFCIISFIFALVLSKLEVSIMTSMYIFILGLLPLFLLANTTIHKEPLLHFLICILKHYICSKKYINEYKENKK